MVNKKGARLEIVCLQITEVIINCRRMSCHRYSQGEEYIARSKSTPDFKG